MHEPMILLNPFALIFALTIGLVLLLHFRRPKQAQQVSNLQLWQKTTSESINRRPIFQKIRRNWLLILQILFLAFVVLALARPSILFWERARAIAFVIDCSASMNARERGGSRIDLARDKALMLLDEVGRKDRVLLVQSRNQPVLAVYSGSDKNALKRALNELSATEASTDLAQAFIAALASVQQTDSYEVFIFSDGTQDLSLPGQDNRIHFIQVGESDNNVAITRFSIRSNPFSPHDQEIFAEVVNFSDRPQDFRFGMSFEGTALIGEDVKLGRKGQKSFVLKAPINSRGIIQSSIDVKDDLDADNRAYAVLNLRKIAVLLVTEGNQFLEKALNVNPQIVCTIRKPEECSLTELRKGYDVVVLDGFEPEPLPPANYLIIMHPPAGPASVGSSLHDENKLVSVQPSHPVMKFVNLENIAIAEALSLQVSPSESVLIEGEGRPLLTAAETGAFRNVTVGFDMRSSNLPLTLSFPVLISNAVNWLSSQTDNPGDQISSGAPLRRRLPGLDRVKDVTITSPDGVVSRPSFVNGILSFMGTEMTGIYTIGYGKETEKFAVNLSNARESSIKPALKPSISAMRFSEQPALTRAGRQIWRVLLLVALAILVLEWLHYHRIRTA
jgi:Ca-activated chloride channel family protein